MRNMHLSLFYFFFCFFIFDSRLSNTYIPVIMYYIIIYSFRKRITFIFNVITIVLSLNFTDPFSLLTFFG